MGSLFCKILLEAKSFPTSNVSPGQVISMVREGLVLRRRRAGICLISPGLARVMFSRLRRKHRHEPVVPVQVPQQ